MRSQVSLQQASRLANSGGQAVITPLALPYRATGPLNLVALQDALREVVRRHSSLRTVFPDGRAQIIDASDADVPLTVRQTGPLSDEALHAWVMQELQTGVDMRVGPAMRASVATITPETHVVILVVDHVVYDGISNSRVQSELARLYEARIADRPDWTSVAGPVPATYEVFCQDQHNAFHGSWGQQCRDYWYEQFDRFDHYPPAGQVPAGATAILQAPSPTADTVRKIVRRVSPEQLAIIRKTARLASASPFSVWVARLLQGMDRVGSPTHGLVTDIHGRVWPAYTSTVGLFAHGLPIYAHTPAATPLPEAIAAVHDSLQEATRYALPLRELSRAWLADTGQRDGVVDRRPFIHFLDESSWRFDRTLGPVRLEYFEPHGLFEPRHSGPAMLRVKLERYADDVYLTIQFDVRVNDQEGMEDIAAWLVGGP
ncbi:condensation domain-containing protein [Streptomyces sp. NPDC088789]|uniref:condensation domain-containing protein n=1 Tax=Streptomyces sp. NPDC088789 TaxID=3365899 RepID=UPI003806CE6A